MSDSSGTPLPEQTQQAEAPKPVLTAAQAKRANQSLKGMVISVVLTVLVAIPVIALNPGSTENTYRPDVDVAAVAGQAAQAADFTPVAPLAPQGWYPNFARWISGKADGVDYWEIGYVTTDEGFVWIRQAGDANPSWIAEKSGQAPVTGERMVDGTAWELRDKSGERTLVGELDGTTVLLSSDGPWEDLDEAARAVQRGLSAGS
ncbi:DUF4245 domain-containing protein [Zafaria sp. Z1313]|uniref:DUF4245 domain-containing protein n=1 Tax=unclassified Zafaria TaxID=2828765 RepID=UPI002E79EFA2|nr:DUF4245 domain-containing protein [Zafaria sp. J156]MEE1619938.1 DUF4245 domain-containing protein [Zafaria sp. J156]